MLTLSIDLADLIPLGAHGDPVSPAFQALRLTTLR
jgi:hypothetical protein